MLRHCLTRGIQLAHAFIPIHIEVAALVMSLASQVEGQRFESWRDLAWSEAVYMYACLEVCQLLAEGFLQVHWFPPPITLTIWPKVLKVAFNPNQSINKQADDFIPIHIVCLYDIVLYVCRWFNLLELEDVYFVTNVWKFNF